jgi:hypothetical protein
MYVNEKMSPVETIPGIREGSIRENDEGGEFKYDLFDILLIHCKNFYKCHNVPSAQ